MRKVRRMGDVTLSMETVIQEMCEDHDLQWGEVINIIRGYLEVHYPNQQEEYIDGSHPVFYYGPKK